MNKWYIELWHSGDTERGHWYSCFAPHLWIACARLSIQKLSDEIDPRTETFMRVTTDAPPPGTMVRHMVNPGEPGWTCDPADSAHRDEVV